MHGQVGSSLVSSFPGPPSPVSADSLSGRAITDEVAPLIERYGPAPCSSHEEDLFIRDFFQDRKGLYSSTDRGFVEHYTPIVDTEEVPTITLTDLLTEQGIGKIDFLSMDIELAEPKALAGFDIDRFHPELVGIEAHPEVRQQLIDYFHAHGYVIVGKYLRADPQNLWFAPHGATMPEPLRGDRSHAH